jgi:hypothetical protein
LNPSVKIAPRCTYVRDITACSPRPFSLPSTTASRRSDFAFSRSPAVKAVMALLLSATILSSTCC